MIKEERIDVHVSYRNITHYKKLGYNAKLHEIIKINPRDLSPVSHHKITAVCDKCGKEILIAYHKYLENEKRCGYYGCKKCSNNKREITSIERFGVTNYAKTDECKNKIAKNNIEKYGVKTTLLEENTKNKINKTIFEKYGVNEILSSKEIIEKSKKTMFDKYGEKYYRTSGKELQVLDFLNRSCEFKILQNDFTAINKELDMYISELKLAIEFNGIYWHSDRYKIKNFHKNKTELCEKNNIQLIQIWEDDWVYRKEIVKSMLLNKINKINNKIYSRKCQLKEIDDNKLIRNFLINNHIQGFVGSQIKIGLFYENELVSLMTFGKQRKSMGKVYKENEFELLRFCNKLNTVVVGGASKLFNYFIKMYKPNEIISYANRCWSLGKMYQKLGFELVKKTEPNYHYFDRKCHRYNRFNFRKDALIKMGYDKSKTEFQIMDELPYYRVYDSGSLKFLYKPIKK